MDVDKSRRLTLFTSQLSTHQRVNVIKQVTSVCKTLCNVVSRTVANDCRGPKVGFVVNRVRRRGEKGERRTWTRTGSNYVDSSVRNYPYWLWYPRIRWIDFSSVSIVLHSSSTHTLDSIFDYTGSSPFLLLFLRAYKLDSVCRRCHSRQSFPLCSHRFLILPRRII